MNRGTRSTALPRLWRGILLGVLMAGCAPEPMASGETDTLGQTPESFEQFMRTVTREKDTGAYLVEGDIAFSTVEQVREYWEGRPDKPGALAVHQVNGVDAAWSGTARTRVTYCISTGFSGSYATVVQAMDDAASAWENSAAVDFQHLNSEDGNCTAANANVVFSVEYTSGQLYTARAFFPNDPRSNRRLLIDLYNATHAAPKTLTGILRHELGHTLGFRHEHTRPEATCFEDWNWRPLTPYDSASVMHYPPYSANCGGTNTGDYVLTQLDREGASSLYGAANRKNFNADRFTDVLWYNPGSGKLSAWLLNGLTVTGESYLTWEALGSTGWDVKGTGDFNRDGHTDVLWYNPGSGQLSVWFLNGTTVLGHGFLSQTLLGSAGWDVKGTGDFNRDGHTDILWYHPGAGEVSVWYLSGTTVTGYAYLSQKSLGSAGWQLKGTGDFNRDGAIDVLWYNPAAGLVSPWYLNGTTVTGYAYLSQSLLGTAGWDLMGTGDFNRDGAIDVLWHHPGAGLVSVWYLNDSTVLGYDYLSWQVLGSTGWKLVSR